MPELSPELSAAPLPLLLLNPDNVIIAANSAAVSMGFEVGSPINDYLHLQGRNVGAEIASAPGNKLWRLTFPDSEKHCYLSVHESESGVLCWLRDMSEQLAIADRLRQMKEPGGKQLRRINHLSSTALGYAELLDVIMEDPTSLAAEQQAKLSAADRRKAARKKERALCDRVKLLKALLAAERAKLKALGVAPTSDVGAGADVAGGRHAERLELRALRRQQRLEQLDAVAQRALLLPRRLAPVRRAELRLLLSRQGSRIFHDHIQ